MYILQKKLFLEGMERERERERERDREREGGGERESSVSKSFRSMHIWRCMSGVGLMYG